MYVREQLWAGVSQGPLSVIFQRTAEITSRHERLALFGLVPGLNRYYTTTSRRHHVMDTPRRRPISAGGVSDEFRP